MTSGVIKKIPNLSPTCSCREWHNERTLFSAHPLSLRVSYPGHIYGGRKNRLPRHLGNYLCLCVADGHCLLPPANQPVEEQKEPEVNVKGDNFCYLREIAEVVASHNSKKLGGFGKLLL
ncbi:hypothetical protein JTE90_014864 [Oedothorax gibbosus]|uniref:Uncharacterized protein n=1 Tax=Oedothorax gibbosus TaxID=931172 RepID=A0AAV6TFZ8_9ARAC|nr:hypothetical protein JTE90_014864 [Oedothorax gibbosus]